MNSYKQLLSRVERLERRRLEKLEEGRMPMKDLAGVVDRMKRELALSNRGVGEAGRPRLAHTQETAGSNPAPAK